jgi:hypothetical protein
VTEQDIASQGSGTKLIGFCPNFFAPFLCGGCLDDAVNPGDPVCSPNCVCTPLPPICGSDAGSDVIDEGDASPDASADASLD